MFSQQPLLYVSWGCDWEFIVVIVFLKRFLYKSSSSTGALTDLAGKVLLTTALQALKPKNMRVSELRAVLTSPLAGIGDACATAVTTSDIESYYYLC